MKFTKDDARKELMGKIPNKGQTLNLSERSINEQLDTLMPLLANEETELNDFIDKVLPIFRTTDANVRHGVSAGIKAYQEEHPQTEPKPLEEPKPSEDDPTAELLKRIEELEKRNADNDKKSTIANRRSNIVAKMREKGCKDNEWIDSLLEEVSLDGEEFDVDARVDKYMKMYNKKEAQRSPNVTPTDPHGTGEDSYLKDVLKAAAEKNRKADE